MFLERKRIDNIFYLKPKAVNCGFRKTHEAEINKPPKKEKMGRGDLAQIKNLINLDATSKKYITTPTIFIGKLKSNSAPGKDLVVSLLIKEISVLHQLISNILERVRADEMDMPDWITTMITILLPKNNNTHEPPKNYRPIGCQNTLCKVYLTLIPWQSMLYYICNT